MRDPFDNLFVRALAPAIVVTGFIVIGLAWLSGVWTVPLIDLPPMPARALP